MRLDAVHQTDEKRHGAGHDENVLEARPHTGIHGPNTIPLARAQSKHESARSVFPSRVAVAQRCRGGGFAVLSGRSGFGPAGRVRR